MDLKPKNILIDGRNDQLTAVIADFGLSAMKSESRSNVAISARGTASYMAPDFFMTKVTEKVDIYSFGIILWEMFYCEEPYRSENIPVEVITDCVRNGMRPTWLDSRLIPSELKTLIEQCWSANPSERPFAHELYETIENYSAMLDFN